MADDPEQSADRPDPDEWDSSEQEQEPKKFQRKRPPNGMTVGRMKQIRELIDQGRHGEVSAQEMAEYEQGTKFSSDALENLFKEIETPTIKPDADSPIVAMLREKFSGPVLRNSQVTEKLLNAFSDSQNAMDELADRMSPPLSRPDYQKLNSAAWLERVAESSAAEAHAEQERLDRAQAAADENNEILREMARIMKSVENGTTQSSLALVELGRMRKASDKAGGRQFWINIVIAAAALLASVLQVLGVGDNNAAPAQPQPTATVTVTATPSPAAEPEPPAIPAPPAVQPPPTQ